MKSIVITLNTQDPGLCQLDAYQQEDLPAESKRALTAVISALTEQDELCVLYLEAFATIIPLPERARAGKTAREVLTCLMEKGCRRLPPAASTLRQRGNVCVCPHVRYVWPVGTRRVTRMAC